MPEQTFKVYPYRWIVLAVFMFINLTIQVLWISYAPITGPAAQFYGVSDLQIGLLAMLFMIIYVPLSLPISWMIDTLGYQKAVGIGAVLLGVFGMVRGIFAASYPMVVLGTVGLAASQPFLLNSISTVAARWFPIQERATAAGLAMVAGFIGIAIGQVTSPLLSVSYGIPTTQLFFGAFAALSAVVFLLLNRDAPPTPPCPPGQEERALMLTGLKSMLRMQDIWFLLFVFLIGMGIFNGVSTWIEEIVRPRGMTPVQAGNLGAMLLVGGVVGSIVIPALSDRFRKRKLFLLLGIVLAIPGLIGIILEKNYGLMLVAMFELGFFMVSLAPIGYQYAAEITYPSPEGTSNGLLNLAGQVSVVFVYAMDAFKGKDGSFTLSLIILVFLMVISALAVANLKESKLVKSEPAIQT